MVVTRSHVAVFSVDAHGLMVNPAMNADQCPYLAYPKASSRKQDNCGSHPSLLLTVKT
jgi:hypothetical protein